MNRTEKNPIQTLLTEEIPEGTHLMQKNPFKEVTLIAYFIEDCVRSLLSQSDIICYFSIPEKLWATPVNEKKIKEILHAIILNSVQAMPDGGTIELGADNTTFFAETAGPIREGNYIKISITCHGNDTPQELLSKSSDPHPSMKKHGNGVELSTAYTIIKENDGYMTVDSQAGTLTTFTIYLPASQKRTSEKRIVAKTIRSGKRRVLVMEDDEITRALVGEMLDRCGYEAEFATGGSQAIKLYKHAKESDRPFDVVIVDLMVPGGMGGKEAIRELLKIDPKAKAIVSSGHRNSALMAEFKKLGFSGVMPKPYSITDLRKTVHDVLNS